MSEKNFGFEKQPNKFENFYHWLSARFPEGLTGAENAMPIEVDGNKMELVIFEPESDSVSFGLFLPDHRYSRKTLQISDKGSINEDTSGVIPDFDRVVDEPKFTSSNDEIASAAMGVIKKRFPDQ